MKHQNGCVEPVVWCGVVWCDGVSCLLACTPHTGAREPGGGAIVPPNYLSHWDGYAWAPPPLDFGNH